MMTTSARVKSVSPFEAEPWYPSPESDSLDVRLELSDGSVHTIVVETPDRLAWYLDNNAVDYASGHPILIARRADRTTVERAVTALAQDGGGRWLQAYGRGPGRGKRGARVSGVTPRADAEGAVSLDVALGDGRHFHVLAATPGWFCSTFENLSLDFYFGPPFVVLRELSHARAAVEDMAKFNDSWLTLYDAPGVALPKLMREFQKKYFPERAL